MFKELDNIDPACCHVLIAHRHLLGIQKLGFPQGHVKTYPVHISTQPQNSERSSSSQTWQCLELKSIPEAQRPGTGRFSS